MLVTNLNVISLFADEFEIKPHGKFLPFLIRMSIYVSLVVFELDVNLLLNYVWSVDSMQKGEAWTPVCVPGCSEQYMLHVYTCFKQQNLGMVIVCCDHTPETLEACHDFCE